MPLGNHEMAVMRHLMRDHTQVVLSDDDRQRIETRLTPVAKAHGLASVSQLIARLRSPRLTPLHHDAIDALLVQSMPFLLDDRVAEELTHRILPPLVAARAGVRRLRFWCPACGGGQAPASLALLLRERCPQLADWDVSILASDRSPVQLEQAVHGLFSPVEVAQGLPTQVLVTRFRRQDGSWQVQPKTQDLIRYATIDVRGPWPTLEPMDLIVIRRVLVYLPEVERQQLVERLRAALAPDGLLFLDSADAATLDQGFEATSGEKTGFYQRR